MIQFIAVIITYFSDSVLGNWQYLFQDMVVVFPLVILMGNTAANSGLSIKRPSANLLSLPNLINIACHVGIVIAFLVIVFVYSQRQSEWLPITEDDRFGAYCFDTSVCDGSSSSSISHLFCVPFFEQSMYYFSNFQYIICALMFSVGRPWKKFPWTNWKLVAWMCVCIALSLSLLFTKDPTKVFFLEEDWDLPDSWRVTIFWIMIINLVIAFAFEFLVFPLVLKAFKRNKYSGEHSGLVFGRRKNITGPKSKLYHRIRGQFELNWKK